VIAFKDWQGMTGCCYYLGVSSCEDYSLGTFYRKSKSILLPIWLHVVANAGYLGGIIIASIYFPD
jgi:hypothetical protein